MRKHNPLPKDKFNSLMEYKQKLTKPDINKNEIEKKVKDIYKNLSKENTFLSNIESFVSIISNAHFNNIFLKFSFLYFSYFILSLSRKSNISEYLLLFKKIQQNYKIYTDEIMIKPILGNNNKNFSGFDFVKISNENVQNKKEIEDKQKLIEESFDSIITNNGFYINNKYYENIPLFNVYLFQNNFYDLVVDYFDDYLKETFCIEYVCKQMQIYDNIFNQLEKMSKKNDWNKFHPQIFK